MARTNFSTTKGGAGFDLVRNTATYVPDYVQTSETVVGVKRSKPSGFLLPTDYSFERYHHERAYGESRHTTNGVTNQHCTGVVGSTAVGSSSSHNSFNNFNAAEGSLFNFPADLSSRAYYSAAEGMKGGSVNLAQAFAERKQTTDFVASTVMDLVKMARAIKAGKPRTVIKIMGKYNKKPTRRQRNSLKNSLTQGRNTFSQRWLETQYAWRPLMGDVYGSVEALSRTSKDKFYFTAHGTSIRTFSNTVDTGIFGGAATVSAKGFHLVKWTFIGVPDNEPLEIAASIGLTNPLLLEWELVPFSFVADWFIPVGDYLNSLDALLGYSNLHSCKTEFSKMATVERGRSYDRGSGRYQYNSYTGLRERVRMKRTAQSSIPSPPLPRFRNPLSANRLTTAISLLTQIFGSR